MDRGQSVPKKAFPAKEKPKKGISSDAGGGGEQDIVFGCGGGDGGDNSGGGGVAEEEEKRRKFSPTGVGSYASGGATRRGGWAGSVGGSGSQPCCLVEKCTADLAEAKRYYRRHKVCEAHSKAPVVIVAGLRQRFCQQCSRFHELSEFDEVKRSCRRRLVGHNERRRKSSSESQGEGSNHFRPAD